MDPLRFNYKLATQPNAHYWVLKLIRDNFGPGDILPDTNVTSSHVAAQAFQTSKGEKLLLINKSNSNVEVALPDFPGGRSTLTVVDEATGENPPRLEDVSNGVVKLAPFAVAVIANSKDERRD